MGFQVAASFGCVTASPYPTPYTAPKVAIPLVLIWFLRSACKNNGFYKGLADLDAKYLIFPCILSNQGGQGVTAIMIVIAIAVS